MKQSAFSRFLNRHIKDINASGTHVTKTGGLLYFDDIAVQFLDRLRGAFQLDLQAPDSAAVLQEEISRLKDVQLNLQQALLVSREELIEVMKDRDNIKNQLSDLSTKYALLAAGEDTSKHLKEENQALKNQLSGTLRDIVSSALRSRSLPEKDGTAAGLYGKSNYLHYRGARDGIHISSQLLNIKQGKPHGNPKKFPWGFPCVL